MKKIQIIALACSIIAFFLIGCLDSKNNAPAPNSETGTTTPPPTVVTPPVTGSTIMVDCQSSTSLVAQPQASTSSSATICFDTQVLPFFQTSCAFSGCHNAQSKQDGYDLSNYASIIAKGIVKGNAANSKIYKSMIETGKDRMPPAPYPAIAKDKLDMIAKWINEGAENKVCANTNKSIAVNFASVNSIIQTNCVGCHKTGFASAGVNLDNYTDIKKYGTSGSLYGSITGATGYKKMPTDGQLTTCDITIIKKWMDLGMPNN